MFDALMDDGYIQHSLCQGSYKPIIEVFCRKGFYIFGTNLPGKKNSCLTRVRNHQIMDYGNNFV